MQVDKPTFFFPVQLSREFDRFMPEPTLVYAVDHPELPPLKMPHRFRLEVVYFMTPAGVRSAPAELPEREYWIDATEATKWLDELVVSLVSPSMPLRERRSS